MLAKVVN